MISGVPKATMPRAIRLLTKYGALALKPVMDGAKYIPPMIKPRVAANLRKRAVIEGTFGSFLPNEGGWDPEWDKERKIFALRPYRGHIRDRNREERVEKVSTAMKGMPDRIKKYDQEVIDRKPKMDWAAKFSRIARLSGFKSQTVDVKVAPKKGAKTAKGGKASKK